MRVWKQIRAAWPGALRSHVTRTGFVYVGAVAMVLLVTFVSGNNLLYLMLAAMLSVLFVSGFVSKLVLSGLEVDVAIPKHVSARRQIRGVLRVKNLKRWMPSFSIHVAGMEESGFAVSLFFAVIPAHITIDEPVQIYFPARGRRQERSFRIGTRFPFGFAQRRELVTLRQEIVVYPCLDPKPAFAALLAEVNGEIEMQQRGQGQDLHRIRPYEAMESWRHVDWKATAHTGGLQVREYAREQDDGVLIYLDLNAPAELDAGFEAAVDCAAYLAHRLAGMGRRVRLRSQEQDLRVPETGDVYTILKYLALVERRPGALAEGPDEDQEFQIVLSADPARMAAIGWGAGPAPGRMIAMAALTDDAKRN